MQLTRDIAVETVKNAMKVVEHWGAGDAPNVNWRGGVVKKMSTAVEKAIDEVCYLCGQRDVAEDARELVLAIDRFQLEVHAWREAIDIEPDAVHPGGTSDLWDRFNVLRDYLTPRARILPEPIRELMEAQVGDEQICRIYGFVKEDGSADMVKLAEEKANPGTHFDPQTWMPRREKSLLAE